MTTRSSWEQFNNNESSNSSKIKLDSSSSHVDSQPSTVAEIGFFDPDIATNLDVSAIAENKKAHNITIEITKSPDNRGDDFEETLGDTKPPAILLPGAATITEPEEMKHRVTRGNVVPTNITERTLAPRPRDSSQMVSTGNRYEMPVTSYDAIQLRILWLVENLIFRLLTIVLIFVDLIIIIIDVTLAFTDSEASHPSVLSIISLTFSIYFIVEVSLRIFAKGCYAFFHDLLNMVDAIIVFVSFIITVVLFIMDVNDSEQKGAKISKIIIAGRFVRVIMLVRIIRLYTEHRNLQEATRLAVGENKRRFQRDGFNLDLCYVTRRVIAMSFPSEGLMSFYRNPIKEVARFFNTKYKDHYRIYNLCSERTYDESHFFGNVKRIMIDDHNVPKLREMIWFAEDAEDFLNESPENVIAVHCKGGKGRTGTIICTWLIHSGQFEDAQDSLEYFGARRTDLSVGTAFQGVQTPSQYRYVEYYGQVCTTLDGQLPPEKLLKIKEICIFGIESVGVGDGSDLSVEILQENKETFCADFGSSRNCTCNYDSIKGVLAVKLHHSPVLSNDVKVRFSCSSKIVPKKYDACAFYFWFYTSFIENNHLSLPREKLDNPHKESSWRIYRKNFKIEITFEDPLS